MPVDIPVVLVVSDTAIDVQVQALPVDLLGEFKADPVVITKASGKFTMAIDRSNLPNDKSVVMTATLEGSHDGKTWELLGAIDIPGDGCTDKNGNTATESTYTIELPDQKDSNYQLRTTTKSYQKVNAEVRVAVH